MQEVCPDTLWEQSMSAVKVVPIDQYSIALYGAAPCTRDKQTSPSRQYLYHVDTGSDVVIVWAM
jgi:hypothetical protein